jgi:hypothetical protein
MQINTTYLRLRRNLGVLGVSLPFILVLGNNFHIQSSISLYYYTRMSVVFTGVLCAFGLFLFSYRGYEKEKESISDNWLTNFAGILAILTALIPTACSNHHDVFYAPNGHDDRIIGSIHLFCASGFLTIMGWLSLFRFTRGNTLNPRKRKRNVLYRFCGIGVWAMLVLLAVIVWFKINITGVDVFIGESMALIFFGTAWLVKGETLTKLGL